MKLLEQTFVSVLLKFFVYDQAFSLRPSLRIDNGFKIEAKDLASFKHNVRLELRYEGLKNSYGVCTGSIVRFSDNNPILMCALHCFYDVLSEWNNSHVIARSDNPTAMFFTGSIKVGLLQNDASKANLRYYDFTRETSRSNPLRIVKWNSYDSTFEDDERPALIPILNEDKAVFRNVAINIANNYSGNLSIISESCRVAGWGWSGPLADTQNLTWINAVKLPENICDTEAGFCTGNPRYYCHHNANYMCFKTLPIKGISTGIERGDSGAAIMCQTSTTEGSEYYQVALQERYVRPTPGQPNTRYFAAIKTVMDRRHDYVSDTT